jgi:hypothetical protein
LTSLRNPRLGDEDCRYIALAMMNIDGGAESAIRTFARGDDAAYQAWIDDHGGYVLSQRSDGFMLHQASCSHLGLTPGQWSLTTRPRRWAQTRQLLIQWTEDQAGRKPLLCQSCM